MTSLGLLSKEVVPSKDTVLDAVCDLLARRLAYGDRHDMVILQHELGIKWSR